MRRMKSRSKPRHVRTITAPRPIRSYSRHVSAWRRVRITDASLSPPYSRGSWTPTSHQGLHDGDAIHRHGPEHQNALQPLMLFSAETQRATHAPAVTNIYIPDISGLRPTPTWKRHSFRRFPMFSPTIADIISALVLLALILLMPSVAGAWPPSQISSSSAAHLRAQSFPMDKPIQPPGVHSSATGVRSVGSNP